MSTTHSTKSGHRLQLGQVAVLGAVAGVIASVPMAMYAMIAAWAKDTGFFTPLYHIASLFLSDDSMMTSMTDGGSGSAFTFEFGPALLGVVIHMMTGAMYGVVFALAISRLVLNRSLIVGAGLVWGAMVFAVSAWIGLPIAAAVFNSGDQITSMAEMAGYGTFVIEHLVYGLVLGLVLAMRHSPAR